MRNCRIPSSWLIKCVCVCVCVCLCLDRLEVLYPLGNLPRPTEKQNFPTSHRNTTQMDSFGVPLKNPPYPTEKLIHSWVPLRFLLDTYHIQRNSIYQWSFLGILYLEMYINLPQSDIDIARHTHIPMSSTGALGGMLDGAFRALYWTCA